MNQNARAISLLLLIPLTLILVALACQSSDNAPEAPESNQENKEPKNNEQQEEELAPALEVTGEEIVILSSNASQDIFGEWSIHGLMQNTADYPVGVVEIRLEALNAGGNLLYENTIFSASYGITPDGIFPFHINTLERFDEIDKITAEVVNLQRFEADVASVEISSVSHSINDSGDALIVGEIVNNSDHQVYIHTVAGALFDLNDEILVAATCDVCVKDLAPGESGPFRILLIGFSLQESNISEQAIYLFAENVPTIPAPNVTVADSFYGFTDMMNNVHVFGEITNTNSDPISVSLLGTAYDSNGNMVNAARYSLPFPYISAGETVPFELVFGGPYTTPDIQSWNIQPEMTTEQQAAADYFSLPTTNSEFKAVGGLGSFTGVVENATEQTLSQVTVILVLRQKSTNKIVGIGDIDLWDQLPVNGELEYSIIIPIEEGFSIDSVQWETYAFGR